MDFVSNIITDLSDRIATFICSRKLFNRDVSVDKYIVKYITNTCYQITDNYIATLTITTDKPVKPNQVVDTLFNFYSSQNVQILHSKFQYTGLRDFKLTIRYKSPRLIDSLKYWINTNTDYRAVWSSFLNNVVDSHFRTLTATILFWFADDVELPTV